MVRGTVQLLNTSDKQLKAEEIKLNVAALGMDLLNNNQAGPNNAMIVSKVNNLVGASVPGSVAESAPANEEADDEGSEGCEESKQAKVDDAIAESPADTQERISIRHLENTLSFEDEVTLDAHRDDEDDFDEEYQRQLK